MVASAAVNPRPDAFVETSVASASTTVVGAFAARAEVLPATVAVKAVRSAADAESDSDFPLSGPSIISFRKTQEMIDAALVAAVCGLCGIVLNKLRCRLLTSNVVGWTCGVGFSEIPLPLPGARPK